MNIQELLDHYRIPYKIAGEHHHATPKYIQVDCPECSPGSGRFRMGLHRSGKTCSCWTCGKRSLPSVLAKITGERHTTLGQLLDRVIPVEDRKKTDRQLVLPQGVGPLLPPHRAYLTRRGFDPDELVRLWNLQGTGFQSKLPWRIVIPVEQEGEVVSWTTRRLADDEPRYVSAKPNEEVERLKDCLFGIDYVRHAVAVVEGPFDVMRIGPGAVCTFGLSYTRTQVRKLTEIPTRIVVFDNEPKAQQIAARLCTLLQAYPGLTFRVQLPGHDPGSAGERELEYIRGFLHD